MPVQVRCDPGKRNAILLVIKPQDGRRCGDPFPNLKHIVPILIPGSCGPLFDLHQLWLWGLMVPHISLRQGRGPFMVTWAP